MLQRVSQPPPSGTSLRLSGNAIDALAKPKSGAAAGMPALAIVTGNFASAIDGDRLRRRGNPPPGSHTAALSCICARGFRPRCRHRQPWMSNEQTGSPPSSIALEIYPYDNGRTLKPAGAEEQSERVPCVTGNVLEGSSNLNTLIRPDAAAVGRSLFVQYLASVQRQCMTSGHEQRACHRDSHADVAQRAQ